MLPDRSQPGRVPETPEKVLVAADPNEGVGERRIQTSAAAGRGGEEIHGQEDEVNHHQHRAWGRQTGVEGVTPWTETRCGLDLPPGEDFRGFLQITY